jgi:uncharacterized phage protein gp47/JayE
MANPDITQYTNLVIYDKDPQDIVDAALVTLQSRLPDWTPSETNLELALLEAMALEVAETIYSINRLPEVMTEVLLTLYGVTRDPGAAPSVTVEFTMADDAGYVIPLGTEISIPISDEENLSFFTNTALTIAEGDTDGTVTATATENTISANGIDIGTEAELVDAIEAVDAVVTTTEITGGIAPETTEDWLTRGIQRLQRLTDTLVIPEHFVQLALEQPYVTRANAIDNYDPTSGNDPGDDAGHITVVVYGNNANVSNPNKATLLTLLENNSSANLGVHLIDPTIQTVNVTATVKKIDSYDSTEVLNDVVDAIEAYLSPTTWSWSGTVRRNELITLISNVTGVDYTVSLTTPSADVSVGADTVLVNAGTVTITVT